MTTHIIVRHSFNNEIADIIDVREKSERMIDRVEMGINRNMNHDSYHTERKNLSEGVCSYCQDHESLISSEVWDSGLCLICESQYENKTGNCSLHCCITGSCDDSC